MRDEPVHRGILGLDIEAFNRPEWTDPSRKRLRDLGNALEAVRRLDEARTALQESLVLFEALQLPEAGEVRSRLGVQ
jgi:hypothetical protein